MDEIRIFKGNIFNANPNSGKTDTITVPTVEHDLSVQSQNFYYDTSLDSYEPENDTFTKLLLHFDGANASTSFVDSSPSGHTLTAQGNAKISTSNVKYGTGVGLFDGSGDYISAPDSGDFDLSSGDWTIDCWVRITDTGTYSGSICSQFTDASNFISFHATAGVGTGQLYMQIYNGGTRTGRVTTGGLTINTNTWYHIAFVRASSVYKCYLDGVDVTAGGSTLNGSPLNFTSVFRIGASRDTGSVDGWNYGRIDDFRLSKGIALWTANFTPPIREVTAVKNMSLISLPFYAESEPTTARVVLLLEDITSIDLNTDLIVSVSKNNGVTWVEGTLEDEGDYDASKRILTANVTLSGSGTAMKYKIITADNRDVRLHGTSLNWD
jgi:hypothetical protein